MFQVVVIDTVLIERIGYIGINQRQTSVALKVYLFPISISRDRGDIFTFVMVKLPVTRTIQLELGHERDLFNV
ncbi:hypothetical protein UWK_01223 [Desulfocapsa sulfexigens DSM 10523]|uniref:Uncharacterized protein n=1 Tax=Desulfocapsa sulfexigens (strain DSM 10523 / SB164P1) TaxID=1167006 RepID=M1PMX0_DESSD|nr:hypothetical protein UWK_01223 [Desulfocapsa sulfexigens DSM 10523]